MTTHHLKCTDCRSSDGLSDYGDHTHCFSCGKHKFAKPSLRTRQTIKTQRNPILLPTPGDMPIEGIRWLQQCGISQELENEYEIYYSPEWQRVIIPSYYKSKLLGWQGRAVYPKQTPKYLQGSGAKPKFFLNKHAFVPHKPDDLPVLVIVEDAVSAIRLSPYINAVALLGTKLDAQGKQLEAILEQANRVVIWLDADKPGQDAARAMVQRLGMVADVLMLTEEEPKLKTDVELASAAEMIYTYFRIYGR